MKAGIHPDNYRVVVFKDMSDGTQFFSRSTAATKDSITIDGVEYPLIKLEISNTSHPFYTGSSSVVGTMITPSIFAVKNSLTILVKAAALKRS